MLTFSFDSNFDDCVMFDVSTITGKANNLCKLLLPDPSRARLAFQIALLGSMIPRQPAKTNIEEVNFIFRSSALTNIEDIVK